LYWNLAVTFFSLLTSVLAMTNEKGGTVLGRGMARASR